MMVLAQSDKKRSFVFSARNRSSAIFILLPTDRPATLEGGNINFPGYFIRITNGGDSMLLLRCVDSPDRASPFSRSLFSVSFVGGLMGERFGDIVVREENFVYYH